MPKITISYRRSDSAGITGRIYDRLVEKFGADNVFMDVDAIPFGVDFRDHIADVLSRTDVVLVVIGQRWLGESASGRRIDSTNDPVRVEVRAALARAIPVIPVLVDDAKMPSAEQLPADLEALAYRNAADIDVGRDFRSHMDRLIRALQRLDRLSPASPVRAADDNDRATEIAPEPATSHLPELDRPTVGVVDGGLAGDASAEPMSTFREAAVEPAASERTSAAEPMGSVVPPFSPPGGGAQDDEPRQEEVRPGEAPQNTSEPLAPAIASRLKAQPVPVLPLPAGNKADASHDPARARTPRWPYLAAAALATTVGIGIFALFGPMSDVLGHSPFRGDFKPGDYAGDERSVLDCVRLERLQSGLSCLRIRSDSCSGALMTGIVREGSLPTLTRTEPNQIGQFICSPESPAYAGSCFDPDSPCIAALRARDMSDVGIRKIK